MKHNLKNLNHINSEIIGSHEAMIYDICLTHDKQELLSVSYDKTFHVYNLKDLKKKPKIVYTNERNRQIYFNK